MRTQRDEVTKVIDANLLQKLLKQMEEDEEEYIIDLTEMDSEENKFTRLNTKSINNMINEEIIRGNTEKGYYSDIPEIEVNITLSEEEDLELDFDKFHKWGM